MRVRSILAILLTFMTISLQAQQALTADPTPDKTNPATMESFQLPSHGALLNALIYIASGAGPHPTVLLLHGFPGNERNLDLAQTLRRAGYNVLYFNYRGSWGSPGDFSFTHCIEDTQAAIAYLHNPANAAKFRTDPNHLILMGHSMGGMVASIVASQEPPDTPVKAIALISAANMGGFALPAEGHLVPAAITPIAAHLAAEGMAPLAGCTPESLARELILNATAWDIPSLAPKLARTPSSSSPPTTASPNPSSNSPKNSPPSTIPKSPASTSPPTTPGPTTASPSRPPSSPSSNPPLAPKCCQPPIAPNS